MRIMFIYSILLFALTGCVSDVSHVPPHDKLVGTVWKLKTDAYVVEYADNRRDFLIIPNTESFGVLRKFAVSGKPYDESNIGKKNDGVKIIAGLRAGETLKVVRVLKHPHIETGTTYHPMIIPDQSNKWTEDRELNGYKLYRMFYDKGILNPVYVEKVE